MRIEVTQEDIGNGKRKSCWGCPIALAVGRTANLSFGERFVGSTFIEWFDGRWHRSEVPPLAAQFIEAFDAGKPVKPFSFELS
jgi:hypothetical protein